MEEFLDKLYSNEYFGFYLIIAIIVLIILFLIILFFGKKDQRKREIEATKKLQQINVDTFKEESNGVKLEGAVLAQNNLENTIVVPEADVPTIDSISDNEIPEPVIPAIENISEEPVTEVTEVQNIEPIVETLVEPVIETPQVEIEVPVFEEQKVVEEATMIAEPEIEINEEPLLERIEEKPLMFEDTTKFGNEFINEVLETPQQEEIKEEIITNEIPEIEVPMFNFDEVVKDVEEIVPAQNYSKGPQIFSSVYVPEKKPEIEESKKDIPAEIKEEPVKQKSNDEFELPSLKKEEPKEEKIEKPILTDYNLDELSGETYTIK